MKILHVSAHYGGGVGTVMRAWRDHDPLNAHEFTHLNNDPINTGTLFKPDLVCDSDLVVCHLWNHPSTFDLILNVPLPPCRLIMWGHFSGLYAPYVYSNRLIEYADRFIFTTPVSYECDVIRSLPVALKGKLGLIWSTYDISKFDSIRLVAHEGFNVGFVGTADYGKLHPQFIDMCAAVRSPVTFIVCSQDSQEHLKTRARDLAVFDRFLFKGAVSNVPALLSECDVFGYPLQRAHFGSCEQVIGEAMACGVVPVVLDNPAEKYIVEAGTGVVAGGIEEYSKAIDYLYTHRVDLASMSSLARAAAKNRYDVGNMVRQWNAVFDEVIKLPKRARAVLPVKAPPYMVYASSLGVLGKHFVNYVFADSIGDEDSAKTALEEISALYNTNTAFQSESKGSVNQYLRYWPHDKYLQSWARVPAFMNARRSAEAGGRVG